MACFELDDPRVTEYFAATEYCAPSEVTITPLAGGVSNHVLLIESPTRRYVVKQSLEKLRVKEDWFSRRDRIWREADALRLLAPMLPLDAVPRVIYEERENYLFAMTTAPGERTWKSLLMAGEIREEHALAAAAIHRGLLRCSGSEIAAKFADQEVFDQLRLDPYYRFTATRHPDLAHHFQGAIERCRSQRLSLVHGDWSPKNMIAHGADLTAIDFEVIHFGDPSFDAAFLLNHLLLKMFYLPGHASRISALAQVYWNSISEEMDLTEGTLLHLPLLMLARIDGKSPAEYIQDEGLRTRIRQFARRLLADPPSSVPAIFEMIYAQSSATGFPFTNSLG